MFKIIYIIAISTFSSSPAIITTTAAAANLNSSEYFCSFNSSFASSNDYHVTLSNFERFEQLKFNCESPIRLTIWSIFPFESLILDESLNLTGLTILPIEKTYFVVMYNLKGFDLNFNPFKKLNLRNFNLERIIWIFWQVRFDFYTKGKLLERHECVANLSNDAVISRAGLIEFRQTKWQIDFCPFVFKKVRIRILSIAGISSSFVEKNMLSFQNISAAGLDSLIFQLSLKCYHVDLNEKILNKHVFERLIVLDLNGPINYIQQDLFKYFNDLKIVRLRSQNIKKILVNNNKWLNSLNKNVNNKMTDKVENFGLVLVIYQEFHNISFYEYPDQDFCQFKSFPHERFVLANLKPTFKSQCTCTELFLIQYSARYSSFIQRLLYKTPTSYSYYQYYTETINEQQFSKCVNKSFQINLFKCNFTRRISNCFVQKTSLPPSDDFFFYVYDWIQV